MNNNPSIYAGFIGFGEVNTPREFIDKRCDAVAEKLMAAGVHLVRAAPVADDSAGAQSARAVEELYKEDFSVLIICIAGWIPNWAVMSVIEPFKHKPIILRGLTGWQDGDRFVTTADQAGSTSLRKPMDDMGYTFKYIVNRRGLELPTDRIVSYCRAADAAKRLKTAKIGMAGYHAGTRPG